MSYELLRPEQVKHIREVAAIAYIPAGSLEWHGRHNPLGTDSLKAHAICCEAALLSGGVVLPPYYLGLVGMGNWGPAGWEGYTLGFNEESTFAAVMKATTRALVSGGWKVLVGVTGHDVAIQRDIISSVIAAETDGVSATGFALTEGELHAPNEIMPYSMDHAGTWETSCMMYTHPDSVDIEALSDSESIDEEYWDMHGAEGVGGINPYRYSSVDIGCSIIKRMGELIGAKARTTLESLTN